MKFSLQWAAIFLFALLPFIVLMAAGVVWMNENQWLLPWIGASTGLGLLSWGWAVILRKRQIALVNKQTLGSPVWDDNGQSAWKKVSEIAKNLDTDAVQLDQWQDFKGLLDQVIGSVASHYHPESEKPALEMPIPQLLKVLELASVDLRESIVRTIPGSHFLTVNDLMAGQRIVDASQHLYNLFRLVSLGVNPVASIVREAQTLISGKVTDASKSELKRWLLQTYVKKVGYYAIELYSGSIVLDEIKWENFQSDASVKNQKEVDTREEYLQKEPLRFLIVGQVNAGKSSLVNALFGEMKALVDVLPQTDKVDPYLLERDGIEQAIVLDTAGYADVENPVQPLLSIEKEVLESDLILLVCSAQTATRRADHLMLKGLKNRFSELNRPFPPVVVALTHIDMLRPFHEWSPPYNVLTPDGLKERMIRDCMDSISDDLSISIENLIPLNLLPESLYNVDEGLVPALMHTFDDTKRLKYLRCLKEFQHEDYWERLWQQTKQSGKIMFRASTFLVEHAEKKLDEWSKPPKP